MSRNGSGILLVENDPDDASLILRAFRKKKILNEIVVMRHGVEALDYLFGQGAYAGRDCSAQPALVLLDINLPKVDGLEVLRRLRRDDRTRLLRVIILTASEEESKRVAEYTMGAVSYVRKPLDFEEFLEVAAQLGFYWLLLNQDLPIAGQP